jgi:hypothetical protein
MMERRVTVLVERLHAVPHAQLLAVVEACDTGPTSLSAAIDKANGLIKSSLAAYNGKVLARTVRHAAPGHAAQLAAARDRLWYHQSRAHAGFPPARHEIESAVLVAHEALCGFAIAGHAVGSE